MKKMFSILLCLLCVATACPLHAAAENIPQPPAGYQPLFIGEFRSHIYGTHANRLWGSFAVYGQKTDGTEIKLSESDYNIYCDEAIGEFQWESPNLAQWKTNQAVPRATGYLYAVSKTDPNEKYAVKGDISSAMAGVYNCLPDYTDLSIGYMKPQNGKYVIDYAETGVRTVYICTGVDFKQELGNVCASSDERASVKLHDTIPGLLEVTLRDDVATEEFTTYISFTLNDYSMGRLITFANSKANAERLAQEAIPPEVHLDRFAKVYFDGNGRFTDIPASAWYRPSVELAYELGLMSGRGDSIFAPDGTVTVAECITLAARLHSIYHAGSESFENGSPWYLPYTNYAIAQGIITASDFANYSKTATRADVAYILSNALPPEALSEINTVVFSAIPDVTMADPYGEEIYLLYRAGVVGGSGSDRSYHPEDHIRRSEFAAIAVRMADAAQRQKFSLAEAAPLPDTFKRRKEHGVTTICHATTSVPEATGLPKLTDAEIDWLIATEDYRLIADSITTLADCVNYYVRGNFTNLLNGHDHLWFTHCCGQQVMAARGGYCGGMCNATHYILNGDYDMLYNLIDGHVQMIFHVDGMYYIINPTDYTKLPLSEWSDGWMNGSRLDDSLICAADHIQTIADSWHDLGWAPYRFQTYRSPGDMFPQSRTWEDPNIWVYPIGTEVTDWLGYEVRYMEPDFRECTEFPWQAELPTIDWTTGEDWLHEAIMN